MRSLLPSGCMFSGVIPRVHNAVLKQFLLHIALWCTKLLCWISQLHLFPSLSFPEIPSSCLTAGGWKIMLCLHPCLHPLSVLSAIPSPSNTPHRLPILFITFPGAPLYTHCRGMPALFPLRATMPPVGTAGRSALLSLSFLELLCGGFWLRFGPSKNSPSVRDC